MAVFWVLPMTPLEISPLVSLVANGDHRTLDVVRQPAVPLAAAKVSSLQEIKSYEDRI